MESKSHSFLVEWTINFMKNKDIISKKIEKIENGKDGFDLHVKYKDREQYVIVAPQLKDIDSIIKKPEHDLRVFKLNRGSGVRGSGLPFGKKKDGELFARRLI